MKAEPGHCPVCGRKTYYKHKRMMGAGKPVPYDGWVKEWCPGGSKKNRFRDFPDGPSMSTGEVTRENADKA